MDFKEISLIISYQTRNLADTPTLLYRFTEMANCFGLPDSHYGNLLVDGKNCK